MRWIHRCLAKLGGIHFAEALVALHGILHLATALVCIGEHGLHLGIGIGVYHLVGLAPGVDDLDAMQGWYGGKHPARIEQRTKVGMNQGEEEASDVGAVDVSVGHENHLAVPGLIEVEGPPRPGTNHLDDRGALSILEHVGQGRLLDVEDLAPDGQQCLVIRAPRGLCRTERAVALDDEQFASLHLIAPAINELRGKRRRLEGGLASLGISMGTRRDPRTHAVRHLVEDRLRGQLVAARGRCEPGRQLLGHHVAHDARCCRSAENFLGLALELRLRESNGDDGGEPLEAVILGDVVLARPQHLGRAQLIIDHLHERPLEPGDMGAPLRGRDHVHEGSDVAFISGVPAQGNVDAEFALDLLRSHVALVVEHGNRLVEVTAPLQPDDRRHCLTRGDRLDILANAALVLEGLADEIVWITEVMDGDSEPGNEKCALNRPLPQCLAVVCGVLREDLLICPPANPGAGTGPRARAGDGQAALLGEVCLLVRPVEDPGNATAKGHPVDLPAPVDLDVEPG